VRRRPAEAEGGRRQHRGLADGAVFVHRPCRQVVPGKQTYQIAKQCIIPQGIDIILYNFYGILCLIGQYDHLQYPAAHLAQIPTGQRCTSVSADADSCSGHVQGVDVVALGQYLVNQLRAGQAFDLLLLKELVSVMTVRPLHQAVPDSTELTLSPGLLLPR